MNGFMEWMESRNIKTLKPCKHTINTKQHTKKQNRNMQLKHNIQKHRIHTKQDTRKQNCNMRLKHKNIEIDYFETCD